MTEYTEITEGSKAIMRDMKQNSSVDQCKGCTLRGDIKACEAVECSHHENWYPMQLKTELQELRSMQLNLRNDFVEEAIEKIKDCELVEENVNRIRLYEAIGALLQLKS